MEKRIKWADVAKGMAIVLVVVGHSINPASSAADIIFSFHMPFFFLISGFLFSQRDVESSLYRLIVKKASRLLLPYFATGAVVYGYWFFIYRHVSGDINSWDTILKVVVKTFLYGAGQTVEQFPEVNPVGPMWFLPCLFVSSVLFWCLLRVPNTYVRWATTICITGIGYVIGQVIFLPWSADISMIAVLFMMVGHTVRNARLPKGKLIFLAILILASAWIVSIKYSEISMNNRTYELSPLAILGAIAGSFLLCYIAYVISLSTKLYKIFSYLGTGSVVILCYHTMDNGYFHWVDRIKFVYESWDTLTLYRLLYCAVIIEIIRRVSFLRSIYFGPQAKIDPAPFVTFEKKSA